MGATWRVSFGLLIPVITYVIYYRIYVLKELQQLKDAKKRGHVEGACPAAACSLTCTPEAMIQLAVALTLQRVGLCASAGLSMQSEPS